jgi:hypothetical protein
VTGFLGRGREVATVDRTSEALDGAVTALSEGGIARIDALAAERRGSAVAVYHGKRGRRRVRRGAGLVAKPREPTQALRDLMSGRDVDGEP